MQQHVQHWQATNHSSSVNKGSETGWLTHLYRVFLVDISLLVRTRKNFSQQSCQSWTKAAKQMTLLRYMFFKWQQQYCIYTCSAVHIFCPSVCAYVALLTASCLQYEHRPARRRSLLYEINYIFGHIEKSHSCTVLTTGLKCRCKCSHWLAET